MSDISVLHLDSVYVKLDCERSVAKELSDFFTFKVPNHEFSPAYKKRSGMALSNYSVCISRLSIEAYLIMLSSLRKIETTQYN